MSSISIQSSGSPIQTALKQQLFRRRHIGPVHHWVTDSDKCQSASFNCLSSAALSFVLIHFNSSAFNKISSLQCSSAYPDKILLYLPTEEDTLLAVWGQKPENEVRWAFSLLIEIFSSTGNITIYKISKNIESYIYVILVDRYWYCVNRGANPWEHTNRADFVYSFSFSPVTSSA